MATDDDAIQFTHVFTKEHPGNITDYYTLDSKMMGEGSYGKVCKGVSKATGIERAVKAIDIAKIQDRSRFEQEIKIQQSLDHAHIVKLHEVIVDARRYYLVMDLCTGGELFDHICDEVERNDGDYAFTEAKAALYMRQILGAMNYLHGHGVAHRDVKPENFLLHSRAADAEIKVIDFGLAARFSLEGNTVMKTRAGTPYYVAPQVLQGAYDEKCDIWSCGVICYILLSGYPPFSADTDDEILRLVKKASFEFPSPEWDNVSPAAKDFICKMMTMDPKQRPSANDILSHEWLQMTNAHATGKISKDLGVRLKKFRVTSKIKKAALSVIAQQLRDEDVQELRRTFQALDANGDGVLTLAEIQEGMANHSVRLPEDLEGVLRNLDTDGSGKIDYTEFIASTLTSKEYLRKDVMWAAFKVFDQDGDGSITADELVKVLKLVDPSLVGQMVTEADQNGDGRISFEEFCNMLGKDA
mmetsp:Transcript_23393/g.72876  ORF Transcript_23393/g.72876 Transcript_23393/m.72876 type:complete len:470 (+) Transcript_23393:34-1443(+)|eukprot:CAMPEP_0204605964 /NCGR_PEP_ID=MMETSP0661-20131031/58804_1 /ASSEMBLY_ACC=CAM_ASM_000606 /TAXON_ID=109239 /ORGANISM="Alexandrium margalefi, Strain AMGDE01CS-322" /LENGTH=469 /DNA_ID=CAMNT_0051617249 /DNA_START=34 /DNA_END=1443 /DNA_ORIENTATION=+